MSEVENAVRPAEVLPSVGDIWEWEPLKPHARQTVRVTEVQWNGDEWMIGSELLNGGGHYWNSLSRWVEATVLATPASEATS